MNDNDTVDPVTTGEEKVGTCAHCGAENPPGLLLCLTCGRDPVSGRDLFAPPDMAPPGEWPSMQELTPSYDLTISLPDPIQVPDPLPIPTLEEFSAAPPQPPLVLPPVYRAPPPEPKDMAPVLSPAPRWITGVLGLSLLALLGLGAAGSLAALNLPGGLCLGSMWVVAAVVWMGLMSARRGETRSTATGARRRLVTSLGQRLFEVTPGSAKEQLAHLPVLDTPSLAQPASQLIYLRSDGDRASRLTRLLLGTMCALVADDHVELASQSYDVLTASLFRQGRETTRRTAVFRRTLYVGAGYLERQILEQLRQSTTPSAGDLAARVLRQAGADLLERIAADASKASPPQDAEAPDLDAQAAAMRAYCDELRALNPELYEQLTQEVSEAVRGFLSRLETSSRRRQ